MSPRLPRPFLTTRPSLSLSFPSPFPLLPSRRPRARRTSAPAAAAGDLPPPAWLREGSAPSAPLDFAPAFLARNPNVSGDVGEKLNSTPPLEPAASSPFELLVLRTFEDAGADRARFELDRARFERLVLRKFDDLHVADAKQGLSLALFRQEFRANSFSSAESFKRLESSGAENSAHVSGLSRSVGSDAVAEVVPAAFAHFQRVVQLVYGPSAVVVPLPGPKFWGEDGRPVLEFDNTVYAVLAPPSSPGMSPVVVEEIVLWEVKSEVRQKDAQGLLARMGQFEAHLLRHIFPFYLLRKPLSPPPAQGLLARAGQLGANLLSRVIPSLHLGSSPSPPPPRHAKFAEQALAIGDALKAAGVSRAELERLVARGREGGFRVPLVRAYLGGRHIPKHLSEEALGYGLRIVMPRPRGCSVAMGKGDSASTWLSAAGKGVEVMGSGSTAASSAASASAAGPGPSLELSPTARSAWEWEGSRLALSVPEFFAKAEGERAKRGKAKASAAAKEREEREASAEEMRLAVEAATALVAEAEAGSAVSLAALEALELGPNEPPGAAGAGRAA